MAALIIDEKIEGQIADLKAFAEKNTITSDQMIAISEGRLPPIGDDPRYHIFIPLNYRVVYTVEEHPMQDGGGYRRCKHISVSISKKGRCPTLEAVNEFLKLFKFKNRIDENNRLEESGTFTVYLEECSKEVGAVNVIELMED